ncbi:hypothetical protein O6H91_05G117800 [Diphasiastrum complanatum]|uniref:Uncharacterized protein n=1 Tax=Diphasiastrum complanatum TaxID=34168 RepID=A0ACC2DSE6_DIPCM|nr:hypothetical protein O6H91_05G117800 [Diphasiastrum complanatum]
MALRNQVANAETVSLRNGRSPSSKISKGERVIENGKQVSGVSLSLHEGRAALGMPPGKPPSSGSSQQSKGQEPQFTTGKGHLSEDTGTEIDSERRKGKAFEDILLLQWGQRKRQRNGRLETTKTGVGENCFAPSKKQLRLDRRVEKIPAPVQTHSNGSKKGHSLGPCAPSLLDTACGDGRSRWSPDKREDRESPLSMHEADNTVACNKSGSKGSYAAYVHEQTEVEDGQGTVFVEKICLEFFEWPKVLISLSRKEKEDDFFAIKGSKLPQRPKKRSKHIEKTLHYVSPGMWLCDLTRERYEVREKKSIKKKPRGLKAMGSVDSDSE